MNESRNMRVSERPSNDVLIEANRVDTTTEDILHVQEFIRSRSIPAHVRCL